MISCPKIVAIFKFLITQKKIFYFLKKLPVLATLVTLFELGPNHVPGLLLLHGILTEIKTSSGRSFMIKEIKVPSLANALFTFNSSLFRLVLSKLISTE